MNMSIVLGIVILVIGISFTCSSDSLPMSKIEGSTIEGNTLYVGGSEEGNYSNIQDAIDNASDGDTVFVYDDSSPYFENIVLDKSIDLIGEDRDTTVIESSHFTNAIRLKSNWVNINGFTICNGSIQDWDGFSNIVISDNHIINQDENDFGCGITLFYVENIVINSNTFTNCDTSITLNECIKNVTISNNLFIFNSEAYFGELEIDCFEGKFITISNNTFLNKNQNEYRTCIHLDFSKNYIIESNEIKGYDKGIGNYYGHPNNNDNNLISHNTFINNYEGISISGSFNKILKNNFINNKKDASSTILPQGNLWDGNYWDEWIGLKIPLLSFLPYFSFIQSGFFIDWNPAKEAYNYTTAQGCGIK
jgi:nitrous oxidase accessory protein NosD